MSTPYARLLNAALVLDVVVGEHHDPVVALEHAAEILPVRELVERRARAFAKALVGGQFVDRIRERPAECFQDALGDVQHTAVASEIQLAGPGGAAAIM